MIRSVEAAYFTIHNLGPPLWYDSTPNLQHTISNWIWDKYLPTTSRRTSSTTLAQRLLHFGFEAPAEDVSSRLLMFRLGMKEAPSFVHCAWLRTAFNGWATTHRFGKEIRPCLWCGCTCSDDLRHYLVCAVMLNALSRIRPLLRFSWAFFSPPPLLPSFSPRAFGLQLSCKEEAIDVLLWMDFLHFMYSNAKIMPISPNEWEKAWKARARVINRYMSV